MIMLMRHLGSSVADLPMVVLRRSLFTILVVATFLMGDATAADNVREVQRLLTELGYDPGPIDGAAGRRSREALREFELDTGIRMYSWYEEYLQYYITHRTEWDSNGVISEPSITVQAAPGESLAR